jgi:two-component system sensor histidine kinase UhpB
MWKSLSLRLRLALLLCTIFFAALSVGAIALHAFAVDQLIEENEPATRSAKLVAAALNNALALSVDPQRMLGAFVEGLGNPSSEELRFEPAPSARGAPPSNRTIGPARVPNWFVGLIAATPISHRFPIVIGDQQMGELLFEPDISADIYEKWISFLSLALAGVGLMVVTVMIAYFALSASLHSLGELGAGLTRLRTGHYDTRIPVSGPPEIRRSCEETNALAVTLAKLDKDNRHLLRRIVSLQDDERRDIARELHDELGPLLFGIRANTVGLLEAVPGSKDEVAQAAQKVMDSAEALQQANRRILDRLRPLHIQELGLEASIKSLLRGARAHLPELKVTSEIAPGLAADAVVSQTIYRVIQEGVTNVLRHAQASSMDIKAARERTQIRVEVSDDGVGIAPDTVFGRGLTGMGERARALGGTFEFGREQGRTFVRCCLPAVASE